MHAPLHSCLSPKKSLSFTAVTHYHENIQRFAYFLLKGNCLKNKQIQFG